MIYQPSNIVPSAWAGEGQNVVSPTDNISISWQVNGNSPMTGFTITIFPNTGNPTTDNTPVATLTGTPDPTLYPNGFYPINGKGNQQYYTYAPANTTWGSIGVLAGYKYKYKITQEWENNNSVEQLSFCTFIVMDKPTLVFTDYAWNPQSVLFAYSARFTISSNTNDSMDRVMYSQAQGDTIESIKWQLFRTTSDYQTIIEKIYDSGIIFTSELDMTFDGILPSEKYILQVDITTSLGLKATSSVHINSIYMIYDTLTVDVKKNIDIPIIMTQGNDIFSFPAKIIGRGENRAYIDTENKYLFIKDAVQVSWDNVKLSDTGTEYDTYIINYTGEVTSSSLSNRTFDTLFSINSGSVASLNFLSVSIESGNVKLYQNNDFTPAASFPIETFPQTQSGGETIYSIGVDFIASVNGIHAEFSNGNTANISPMTISTIFINLYGEQKTKQLQVDNRNSMSMLDHNFLLRFDDTSMNGGNYSFSGVYSFVAYRRVNGKQLLAGQIPTAYISAFDYSAPNETNFQYGVFYKDGYGNYFRYSLTPEICVKAERYYLLETYLSNIDENEYIVKNKWIFNSNMSNGTVTNNNSPNWLTNFTPYRLPQPTKRMGRSGSLTGLISNPVEGKYQDTAEQMNEIFALSQSDSIFFLKDPKGNLYMVRVSAPITSTPAWGTPTMQTTFSLPWEEIGDASQCSVIEYGELREE